MVNFNLTSFPYIASSSIIPNEVKNSFLSLQWLNGTQGNISFKCFVLFPNALTIRHPYQANRKSSNEAMWLVRLPDSLTCLFRKSLHEATTQGSCGITSLRSLWTKADNRLSGHFLMESNSEARRWTALTSCGSFVHGDSITSCIWSFIPIKHHS